MTRVKNLQEKTFSPITAVQNGFYYIGVLPNPVRHAELLERLDDEGCVVALCSFDDQGHGIWYPFSGVWANPAGSSRKCGCVNCADQGISCEHDPEVIEKIRQEFIL